MKRLLLLFLFVRTFANAQEMTFDTVQDSLLKQLSVFPQEKIHVHTDRQCRSDYFFEQRYI